MYICAYCRKPCSPNAYACPNCGDPNPELIEKPQTQSERKTNAGFMDKDTSHNCIIDCQDLSWSQMHDRYGHYRRFFEVETFRALEEFWESGSLNPVHPKKGIFSIGDLANYLQGNMDSPFHD